MMFEESRDALLQVREALGWAPDWAISLIIFGLAATLALGIHAVVMHLPRRMLGNRPYSPSVLRAIDGPTRLALVVLAFGIALPTAPLNPGTSDVLVRL